MKKWKPEYQECRFVSASDVFAGLPKAWDTLCECSCDFTWGDNNRSLVAADAIRRELADAGGESEEQSAQVEDACKRLEILGQEYVDMES